jgi:hypothetical protein
MNKKNKYYLIILLALILAIPDGYRSDGKTSYGEAQDNRIRIVNLPDEHKVDIFIDSNYFTSYIYPDNIEKPVLYPLISPSGLPVTRGFPLDPRPGERVDHPHHVGLWFNYGDVNGLDFWNNSYNIPEEKKDRYGIIRHRKIRNIKSENNHGILEVTMDWLKSDRTPILREESNFIFFGMGNYRAIDRIIKLTALDTEVIFTDNKEGLYAIRTARAFESPSDQPQVFYDANGNPTEEAVINNEGVNGNYRSSEGIEGTDVWGTRAKWVTLSAVLEQDSISLAIIDHPENPGFPTYWHARGYGLFSANNLGQKIFSEGKKELNFKLEPGETVTFRYRFVIHSGYFLTDKEMEQEFKEFSKKYQD